MPLNLKDAEYPHQKRKGPYSQERVCALKRTVMDLNLKNIHKKLSVVSRKKKWQFGVVQVCRRRPGDK